jgi:predicted Ser/Thr protein kinase
MNRSTAGCKTTNSWKLQEVRVEYEDIVKNEGRWAIAADEAALRSRWARRSNAMIEGDLCPFWGQMYNERLANHDGDWHGMLDGLKVYRLILSEQDRIGIGTFQTKDEKNRLQKALELKLFEDQKDTIKLTSLVSSVDNLSKYISLGEMIGKKRKELVSMPLSR